MSEVSEIESLVAEGKFDQAEEAWMAAMERNPGEVDEYLAVAKTLRKAGERSRSDTLLDLLAEAQKEENLWPQRLKTLCEIGRLSKRPSTLRDELRESLTRSLGGHDTFDRVMAAVDFDEKDANPVEKAERVASWLNYDVGEVFFMGGRGVGIVTELNPELGLCRLDFEVDKRVSVPLGAAPKYLEAIGPDYLLRRRYEDLEALRAEVKGSAADSLGTILRDFGRSMTASEIKDAVNGIVPSSRWSSWWSAARKNPQVVASGSGSRATYSWKASSEEADEAVLARFEGASLREKIEIARRDSTRSGELADRFALRLAKEAEKLHSANPATAWEILCTLEKLPGKWTTTMDPAALVTGPAASKVISRVSDRMMREKALDTVRESHPSWQTVYAEVFYNEEDPRVLTKIWEALEGAGADKVTGRLLDETLRYPRRHPHAWTWYARRVNDASDLPEKLGYPFLFQLCECLGMDEFAPVRARLKELFDKGGLVLRMILSIDDLEQAGKIDEVLERHGGLEAYRRETVRAAIGMKYPQLHGGKDESIIATAESAKEKRDELERLRSVEIPANLKALKEARELGDLSENFEYKSARQRQEYLSARVATLENEVRRVRILDPAQIDASEIRVGTTTILRNGDLEREITILGPWESDPERGVYSLESDAARSLMGHHEGDIVSFMGTDYYVGPIRRWAES